MEELLEHLQRSFQGEITLDGHVRRAYSHDASIYEMLPGAVLFPTNSADIKKLVRFVAEYKHTHPTLSITPRGAGTDMSGGAISNSLLIDLTKHFTRIRSLHGATLSTQPGVFVRAIDPLLAEHGLMLGSAPASRALCTIGGMVANNSGGEQSLRYGNTERAVRELKAVLADGNEYTVRPLTRRELEQKIAQKDFEGDLYRRVHTLIDKNYDILRNARPKVSKNSMGYNLWSVWDREAGVFDMTRLLTGSQGTLGIITDISIEAVPQAPATGMLVIYLKSTRRLGDIITAVMRRKPATFEGFDDITFELGIKHFKMFRRQLGTKEWLRQQTGLLGSIAKFKGHLPTMVLMAEFDGASEEEVQKKVLKLQRDLAAFRLKTEVAGSARESARFWQIRRASFGLLRDRIHDKYASPFIDDLTVRPKHLSKFLPELRKIIRKYNLPATIAGHMGDGNFHIIPLMDLTGQADQAKLEPTMREVAELVLKYDGSLAGEHNDGMVRGPWLPAVFGDEVYQLFKQTKEIFDPQYIFNPHKKTDAAWDFSMEHIRHSNRGGMIK